MSRRDTIIIAVLVNAALLMILFATSSRSGEKETKVEREMLATTPIVYNSEIAKTPAEELEEVLSQYVAPSLPQEPQMEREIIAETFLLPEAKEIVAVPLPTPTPAVVQEHKTTAEFFEVVVKKGDVLEKIAHSHGTTVASIMTANHLSSTQLKIGQVLQIPGKSIASATKPAASTTPKPASTAAPKPASEFYTVKEGDNPWLIASKNRIKLDDLLRLNELDEKKARRLRPGDKLRLR